MLSFFLFLCEELMSFDLSSTSEKLSHPTANRPKMPGRRLPAQFGGGHSVSTHTVKYQHATENTQLCTPTRHVFILLHTLH